MAERRPFAIEEQSIEITPGGTNANTSSPLQVTPGLPQQREPFAIEEGEDSSATIDQVIGSDPNAEAQNRKTSQDLGVPIDLVRQDPQGYAEQEQKDRISSDLADSPVSRDFLSNQANAAVAYDDTQYLSSMERLGRSFERGELLHQLGKAGTAFKRAPRSPEAQAAVKDLQQRLQEIGEDPENDFVNWLGAAAEVLGQQKEAVFTPEMARNLILGLGVGSAAGVAGGPLAPITVPAGAGAGLTAGFLSGLMMDAFEVEGGLNYVDMREMGVDHETAAALSTVVGIINAGLEVASDTVVLKPLSDAAKSAFRQGVRKAMREKGMQELAKKFVQQYGAAIGAEVSTEVLQEMVNISAEEIAKELEGIDAEDLTAEEVAQRISGVASQTFKAMTVLAAPGPTVNIMSQSREAIKAKKDQQTMDQMAQEMQASETMKRDPEVAANHVGGVMAENEISNVWVPADRLTEWIFEQENPEALMLNLGISDSLQNDLALGGDVKIKAKPYAQYILGSPNYAALSDHIRTTEAGMTAAEATEFSESGLREEIDQLPDLETSLETIESEPLTEKRAEVDTPVAIAEFELGLGAMFKTADEAGMTPGQYAKYLEGVENAHNTAIRNREDQVLAQEQKELTKEWNTVFQQEREKIAEQKQNELAYQTIRGLTTRKTRLDRATLEAMLEPTGLTLDDLPSGPRGKKIYTTSPKEKSISPEVVAELYGYETGQALIEDVLTTPDFDTAVNAEATAATKTILGDTLERRQSIVDARQALHNDAQASVLAEELNALREARTAGRISPKLLRSAARNSVQSIPLKDLTPNKFLANERRLAKASGKALRQGDRKQAAQLKFQQNLNYHMAKEAYQVQKRLQRQQKYMKKFLNVRKKFPNLPADNLAAIRQLLARVNYGNPRTRMTDTVTKVSEQSIDPIQIPDFIENSDSPIFWQDLSLQDFTDLHDTIKEIDKKGRDALKTRRAQKEGEVQEVVDDVTASVRKNMPKFGGRSADLKFWTKVRKYSDQVASHMFSPTTITREADGFVDNGVVWQNLVSRYETAVNSGYRSDQIGLLQRQQQEALKMTALFKVFSVKEQKNFNKKVQVPGLDRAITINEVLSVLLNSGNKQNLEAMVDGGPFSEAEIQAIQDFAPKKYWDFAQSVWNYLDTLYPEIAETQKNRTEAPPQRVQAQPIETQHGVYKGGYYPIRYDTEQSFYDLQDNVKEIEKQMRKGNYLVQHTRRGHVEQRKKANKNNQVKLDTSTLMSHVNQVVYDLEVGDALADTAKVLYHPDTKKAFNEVGAGYKWDQLDIWFRDITTNEIVQNNDVEHFLRWIRSGITISSLAWNIGVIALQPLGIINAGVQLGKKALWQGLKPVMANSPFWLSKNKSIFNMIDELSPFMASRAQTFDKDILDAQTKFRKTWFDRATPGLSGEKVKASMFYGIRKTQRWADAVVWMAAFQKANRENGMSQEESIKFADSTVARTQGSGVFGQRTKFERGTINKNIRQTEMVRVWTTFISFFIAKFNVVAEKIKKTGRNPVEVFDLAFDMFLIYTFEAMMVGLIRGEWPDEDDDQSLISYAAEESINTVLAGIPGLREVGSAVTGFDAGGTVGNVAGDFGNAVEQMRQGELDTALLKSLNSIGGVFFKYPSSQINKTAEAIVQAQEGEDLEPMEFIMGPHFDR